MERPEPSITTQDEIKVRIIRVGICGLDREEVSGGRSTSIGHHSRIDPRILCPIQYARLPHSQQRTQHARPLRRTQLPQCHRFDLPDPLASQVELLPNLLERVLPFAPDAEP